MRLFFITSLFLILIGCASNAGVRTDHSDRGVARHIITCENAVHRCYDKAADLCPKGYLVLNRVRGRNVGDVVEYELRIKCREGKVFY